MKDRRLPLVLSGLTAVRVAASFFTYVLAARRFGVGPEMDLFFLAVTPLLAVINITEAAGVGAAINFYARLQGRSDAERDGAVAGLFAWVGGGLLLFALGYAAAARPMAVALGGDLPPPQLDRLVGLLRLSAVAVALAPIGLVAGIGLLRARARFLTAASLAFVPSLVQIVALLTVADTAGRFVAAFVAGHALAALAGLRTSAREVRPMWRLADRRAALAFLREVLPFAVAELALQGIYIRERQLAAGLPPGSLSALALGQRLVAVAGTVVSTGIEHTALPTIAAAQFGGDAALARRHARHALLYGAVLTIAAGIPVFAVPELWVTLAFRRGAFDDLAVALTAGAAAAYVGLYAFNALGRVAIAAAFGRGRGWRIAAANGLILAVYLGLSAPMARAAGYGGLALAASIVL
ncbi:MAG TPA: lipid II flippase MurJ, partial [Gemmatimonadales bacterium]|nr:lipid II flippase MurJ [Gemmatimonadales bacterium]